MATAQIVITQAGASGAGGKSRDDIVAAQLVTLRNADDNGVVSWRWSMTPPKGSSATLSNVTAAAPSFTPDVAGTYVVELEVNRGSVAEESDRRLVAVRNAGITIGLTTYETRYIGIGEDDEANWNVDLGGGPTPNTTGWWEDLDRWLRLLYAVASGGGGGSDWAATLAAGNNSGANDPLVDNEQQIEYGVTNPAVPGPAASKMYRTGRRLYATGGGLGVSAPMGAAIASSPLGVSSCIAIVKVRASGTMAAAGRDPNWSVLEEVWELVGGTRERTILAEHDSTGPGFELVMSGTSLYVQMIDLVGGDQLDGEALVDVVLMPGPNVA